MPLINWKRVPYGDEEEEFDRTVKEFTENSADIKANTKFLQLGYKTAKSTALTDLIWKKLKNSDSYTTTKIEDIQKAIKVNKEPRNIVSIINEFVSGTVRLPIAIKLDDGTYYLVAGNTRLMVARMLEITPKIIVIETDW